MQNNNQSVASLSSIKSSPIKLMKITRNLGGKSVSDSLRLLRFSKLKMAKVVYDVLYSAMSNAENNHNLDIDNLFIKRFDENYWAPEGISAKEIFLTIFFLHGF